LKGSCTIHAVTADIEVAVSDPDLILITTPATAHRELAELIGRYIKKIHLDSAQSGRTFGALEFKEVYEQFNQEYPQTIAETQTIIYTCRKTAPRCGERGGPPKRRCSFPPSIPPRIAASLPACPAVCGRISSLPGLWWKHPSGMWG